ncbi:MAG: YIP1 family protein [ANME-2 cluster archaeon]|nr:YIP1 family protein [ANME-2 cluster archaeon]
MDNYVETLKKVLTNPEGFYSEMPKSGGYQEPLTFAAINFAILGLLSGIVAVILSGASATSIATTLIGGVIGGIIGLFIGGVILFIFFKIFGGSGSYEGTVRIMSYSSAVNVFAWVPVVGGIIGLYGIWLNIVGGKHVHNLTTVKSAIAVLLPLIILGVIVALMMAVIIAAIAALGLTELGGM